MLYLFALGLGALAVRLFEDKLPEEAVEFATSLRNAVKGVRKAMSAGMARATKQPAESLEDAKVVVPDVGWEFQVKEAFSAIDAAAAWHEKVGRMFCGIHAWF